MAPKLKLSHTEEEAHEAGNRGIKDFFLVKRGHGRYKTMWEEIEQETTEALKSQTHGQPKTSPSDSTNAALSAQKRKSPPCSQGNAPAPKRIQVNWSKGEALVQLDAAVSMWTKAPVDDNGEALSIVAFANLSGIPPCTFQKYATGRQKAGDSIRRPCVISADASCALVDLVVQHDQANDPKTVTKVIDICQELHPELTRFHFV